MEAIDTKPLTVALGPAGTGKTYLAISAAVEALEAGTVSRIMLSRPAVEAGENLGFLPGDMPKSSIPICDPCGRPERPPGRRACARIPTTARSRSRRWPSCAAAPSTTASC